MALRILQLGTVFAIGLYFSSAILFAEPTGVASNVPLLDIQIEDPKDVIVVKGQSATLHCNVQSTSFVKNISIEWLYNDTKILKNDTKRILQQDGSLYIPKVYCIKKTGNVSCLTGSYRCNVSYDDGALLSNSATLKIASIEREFSKLSNGINVFESQPTVLFCIIHSVPTADIQWEHNNKRLPQNSRYVPLPKGALLITKTHSSDAGSYRCIAKNNVLEKTKRSKIIELSVSSELMKSEAPTFLPLDVLSSTNVLVGESIYLYCAVTGWPIPTIQWLNNDNKIISNTTILQINNATIKNSGNYTCIAYNDGGRISQNYYINVYEKPYFNVTPISQEYPNAKTIRLGCQAKGVPEPYIEWYKDGKKLNINGRIKKRPPGLVISHTFSYDSGIYQCFASNSVGKIWSAAKIIMISSNIPSPPQNVQCRPFDDNSICVYWKSPQNLIGQVYYTLHSFVYKDNALEFNNDYVVINETVHHVTDLSFNKTYMFYVRLLHNSASDDSNHVTCRTGTVGNRNLRVIPINDTSVELKWSKISKDVPCNGTKIIYKVMWRRKGSSSSTVEYTDNLNYLITGLSASNEYEFNIVKKYDTNSEWVSYNISNGKTTTDHIKHIEINNNMELIGPENVEAIPISPTKINLTWYNVKGANYYNICYIKVKEQKKCEDSDVVIKSIDNSLEVVKLEPNTVYEFKVKAHKSEEQFGPYSKSIEIQTPADVPSTVLDLNYKVINNSAICLHWKAPLHKNGNLIKYLITYTPDKNWPINKWYNISIPSNQRKIKTCWSNNEKTQSILLVNLKPNKNYTVLVRAESNIGLGMPIIGYFTTNIKKNFDLTNDSQNNIQYNQKLGIIMGVTIALICIIFCISCILARKQCLKSRALARTRMVASNNYYPAIAHYASDGDAVQVRLEDPCSAEIHEIEHLVNDDNSTNQTHIPSITTTTTHHLDTKGAANFPNGHISNAHKPLVNGQNSNGNFNIIENPRYLPECNGHIKKKYRDQYEEDSNSNLKMSKLSDLQRLFENSKSLKFNKPNIVETNIKKKKFKTKRQKKEQQQQKQCNPHFENFECNGTTIKDASSEDESLNSTQFTILDNSLQSTINNHRRVSPVLGPNG